MEDKFRWPRKGDDPFFVKSANPCSPTWASLSWLEGMRIGDSSLALAFKECGDKVVTELERGESIEHPDMYFIPIGYLYRHSLELKMKQVIRLALKLELLEKDQKIVDVLDGHALYPLWNYVKLGAQKLWPGDPGDELKIVEGVIQSLHQLDKSGQGLRYTKDSSGQSTLLNLPTSVDLSHFKDVFEGVFNLLDGCESAFEDTFQTMGDMWQDCGP